MYEQYFNLTAEPFRLSPDHRFCFSHAQYAKAKAYMAYAFMRAEGFVMVTGQPGTGKTTLIGDLVESLADENVAVANLVSTQLAADDLLRMVAFAFGLDTEGNEKSTVLQQLNTCFLTRSRQGGRSLLIVDEAQALTPKAMEELRLLTNLQQDAKPLLQIFLLGQPELRDLVHDPALEQVHQRIVATSHLRALREDETRAYVEHRLKTVGWKNDPAISKAVFPVIYLFSEGVPRRINLICSRLFLHSCVEQRHEISVADARVVVEELQEEQLSTRNLLNDDVFFAEDEFELILEQETLAEVTDIRSRAATGGIQHQVDIAPVSQPDPVAPNLTVMEGPEQLDPVDAQEASHNVAPESEVAAEEPLEQLPPEIIDAIESTAQEEEASPGEGESVLSRKGSALDSNTVRTLLAALVLGGLFALAMGTERFL